MGTYIPPIYNTFPSGAVNIDSNSEDTNEDTNIYNYDSNNFISIFSGYPGYPNRPSITKILTIYPESANTDITFRFASENCYGLDQGDDDEHILSINNDTNIQFDYIDTNREIARLYNDTLDNGEFSTLDFVYDSNTTNYDSNLDITITDNLDFLQWLESTATVKIDSSLVIDTNGIEIKLHTSYDDEINDLLLQLTNVSNYSIITDSSDEEYAVIPPIYNTFPSGAVNIDSNSEDTNEDTNIYNYDSNNFISIFSGYPGYPNRPSITKILTIYPESANTDITFRFASENCYGLDQGDDDEHILSINNDTNIQFDYIDTNREIARLYNDTLDNGEFSTLDFVYDSNTTNYDSNLDITITDNLDFLQWLESTATVKIDSSLVIDTNGIEIKLHTSYDDEINDLLLQLTNVSDYSIITDTSGGIGGDGDGGGGSGDPYIHPLIGPVYKLPDAPGNCRFISTKEDLDNRFLVDMSIEKLTFDEQKDLLKQHLLYNRDVLQKNKITIDGYYFRNFYISNKNNYLIVNLEDRTLKSAEGEITLDHLYKKGGVATYKNFEISVIKTTKNTYKKIANYDKTLVVYTVKVKTYNEVYGNVEIELFSLDNKQIRNSIQIYTDKSITVNNSVGAYLMPQHINNIYVNELGSHEMLEDVKPYNEKDFNIINEKHYHYHNSRVINKKLLIQK